MWVAAKCQVQNALPQLRSKVMLNTLRLSLILLLVLTGVTLGAARGQARIAGEIVLCSGSTVMTVAVDDQGQPVKHMMICPDMALSLMLGIHDTPSILVVEQLVTASQAAPASTSVSGIQTDFARARGPPSSFLS